MALAMRSIRSRVRLVGAVEHATSAQHLATGLSLGCSFGMSTVRCVRKHKRYDAESSVL